MIRRTLLVFLDPIEDSSYPVTESGYALLHRLWLRCAQTQDAIYIAYPQDTISLHNGHLVAEARPLVEFSQSPYHFYREQRSSYDAQRDVGAKCCHIEGPPVKLLLSQVDAIMWRQEQGEPRQQRDKLSALTSLRERTLLFLDPELLLSAEFSSKALPSRLAPNFVPTSFCTCESAGSTYEKTQSVIQFIHDGLGNPETAILKPFAGDNGQGITFLGKDPRDPTGSAISRSSASNLIQELLEEHGDVVVQEYIPSIRAPAHPSADRTQFGEVRFLLIDGKPPQRSDGKPLVFAHRCPTGNSIVADSGISQPTHLTPKEVQFLEQIGKEYQRLGIHFGGGDIIRTPNPERPFVFTDAARAVCGHIVVTGALNGEPYLIVDQVLDCFERCYARHLSRRQQREAIGTPAPAGPTTADTPEPVSVS